jgi:hypothetical protein
MIDHVKNRGLMLDALREELAGPAPMGKLLDCMQPIQFLTRDESYKPYRQLANGEEILVRGDPLQRYGVGVLYPNPVSDTNSDTSSLLESAEILKHHDDSESNGIDSDDKKLEKIADSLTNEAQSDDFDLSLANAYQPSSSGVSFLAEIPPNSLLIVELPRKHLLHDYPVNGRYEKRAVRLPNTEFQPSWWLRMPISLVARFHAKDLLGNQTKKVKPFEVISEGIGDLRLEIEIYSRPHEDNPEQRLLTVCLINRTETQSTSDSSKVLFQTHFHVHIERDDNQPSILPYPGAPLQTLDNEEKSIALLYRDVRSFATGHGCSANWSDQNQARVSWVSAENMPTTEVPATTPNIFRADGKPVNVSMELLSHLEPNDTGFQNLEEIVQLYEGWIAQKRLEIPMLEPKVLQEIAEKHLKDCEDCAARMRDGLTYLVTDPNARFAFQLANQAILLQQICGSFQRVASFDEASSRIVFDKNYQVPIPTLLPSGRGTWRAFQIAFLLMSLRSSGDATNSDCERVELIWFPTGGGKTEAYLGLTAFALFLRRLQNPTDVGVHTLMRYTLRLLTAQQFQRASGLIVAMEHLRRKHVARLGSHSFSIGIWLGSKNTPNSNTEAVKALNTLLKEGDKDKNPFLVTRCPWCGATLGVLSSLLSGKQKTKKTWSSKKPIVEGYVRRGHGVGFRCNDPKCEFHRELPIYVVDEDIYEQRPSLVIGTADKFAQLAWKPEARALFGLNSDGQRDCSPPGLIIQDELHLIAGPLGSMVGLYELLIEELCTDRRGENTIRPKIVCSTATIRRYQDQIEALYNRKKVTLFPPPGLEAGDSFFSKYETDESGKRTPGRLYVGVNAPSLGSVQTTEVRVFSALAQAALTFQSSEESDPWWTNLIFHNSLRELGNSLSLFQFNIPEYLKSIVDRLDLTLKDVRYIDEVLELTSRLDAQDVPEALQKLEVPTSNTNPKPVDVCLASSIIEVGIDIDRLSLMSIVGQPKSTSQYIQVSGRVGRNSKRPGLVVTLYAASKPRDRSHFEKFRSYHERLYAQVEPTSVTPFSAPAVKRALHAVMAAYVRQTSPSSRKPIPFPRDELEELKKLLLARVNQIDPREAVQVEAMFNRRMREWEKGERSDWAVQHRNPGEDPPLLYPAGKYMPEKWGRVAWDTPQSMRNVDSECVLEIDIPDVQEGSESQGGGY